MTVTLWLVCVCIMAASAQDDAREWRIVQTAQGPVKGYKNNGIFEFLGIPYATAPTGTRRFTAPLPGPVWMHPYEAVSKKVICPQPKTPYVDISSFTMQEECLIANVYMSDTEETNLPVMVYVHGGGYQIGWGELITTHTLVKSKKIVAVTFNYRLFVHGFLCLGTEDAPGNAGMKDQVALLRWVKKNIANFGGNPNDVTIVGSSAGSSSVDLLMLSESTAGLFNKVIPESGANVAAWSVKLDPVQFARDFVKSKYLNESHDIKVDNINGLEEFYKTASYDLLLSYVTGWTKDSIFGFVPCVERNLGLEMFLEETPVNILKQGNYRKVPVLYGFANMEGLIVISELEKWKNEMNEHFENFLPGDLQFHSDEERHKVAQTIKQFYFGDKAIGEETAIEFVNYFTDVMFAYGHLRATQLQVEAGNDQIYLYEYSFYAPPPQIDTLPEFIQKIKGANHCAQSDAVHDFTVTNLYSNESEEHRNMKKTVQEMWLNFIITGKPVPEWSRLPAWPPVGANRSPYMTLGEEIKLKGSLLEKRAKFWDGIYERYYRMPVPPSSPAPVKSEL